MTWTTPADLAAQVERLWTSGRIPGAIVSGEALFPLRLKLRGPDRSEMADRFGDARAWIQALERDAKGQRGFGYEIVWGEINHRQLGRNRAPAGILAPTERDALRLIRKEETADRFRKLAQATVARFPALKGWLARKPFTAIDCAEDWERILAVVEWFACNPRSGLYLRQVDIPGVDTKFIEARKGLLSELIAVAAAREPPEGQVRSFEQRHGLRAKPTLIRLRLLDPRLAIGGLRDLSVPAADFAVLGISPDRVFITENEINGLSFPEVPGGLVVFGLGYGVDLLSEGAWLKDRALYYWGDIDTHGFAMLDRLRASFPHTQSFLMDRSTLLAHRALWGSEPSQHMGDLNRLHDDERALHDDLLCDRLGQSVRLEQERIRFSWLERALAEIAPSVGR